MTAAPHVSLDHRDPWVRLLISRRPDLYRRVRRLWILEGMQEIARELGLSAVDGREPMGSVVARIRAALEALPPAEAAGG